MERTAHSCKVRLRERAEADHGRLSFSGSHLRRIHPQRTHGKPDGEAEKEKNVGEMTRFEKRAEADILWFICASFLCRQNSSKSRHLGWRFSAEYPDLFGFADW